MEIIPNQTIYKCSYCGRKTITKNGIKAHEKLYCRKNKKSETYLREENNDGESQEIKRSDYSPDEIARNNSFNMY